MSHGRGMPKPTEKPQNFWGSARRLGRYLRPHQPTVAAIVALTTVSTVLSVYGPRMLGRATDVIVEGVMGDGLDRGRLAQILLITLGMYVAAALLSWAAIYLTMRVVQAISRQLRSEVEEKLHRLPLPWLDAQPRGDVLSRTTNDIDNVTNSLQQILTNLLQSLLTVVGVLAMMFAISWSLSLVALATIPVAILLTGQIAKRSQVKFRAQWKATGDLNGRVEEAFTGHDVVRAFGREAEVATKVRQANDELYESALGAQFISGIIMPAMTFVGNLGYVLVAVIGGIRVAHGSLSLGDVQAFIQYSRQFTQPVTQIASMANLAQSGMASAERVFVLLDAPDQVPEADRAQLTRHDGRVTFENISFRYQADTPLIDDLSLVVEPGQTVAIVGPTGAGKTTLVNLVMRFYELDDGRITLDGVDIADMPRAMLRDRIGMVLQDTWLFRGSIAENIAYGRPGATRDEVVAAAEAAYVDRFVHSLPDGYDTVLEEDASNISAGERQLITIARAFISEPDLLILDEATSSVDTRTEVQVQRAMRRLRADRTSFVIAHRLSTIRDADVILVMESGRIVEQGTHAQLLAAGGAYARLHAAMSDEPSSSPS